MPPPVTTGSPTVSGGIDPTLLARALAPALTSALSALGAHEQAAIEQTVSHPVERGPGGHVTKRSPDGGYPWMDEGILHGNIGFEVEPGELEQLPTLTIYASRPEGSPNAAYDLEYGHGKAAERPFMRPALVRLEDYAADFIAGKLSQSL
jgi:hypothetical protein